MEASDVIFEIKDFVRERLRVQIEYKAPCFGSSAYLEVKMLMDDEVISESIVDVPRGW